MLYQHNDRSSCNVITPCRLSIVVLAFPPISSLQPLNIRCNLTKYADSRFPSEILPVSASSRRVIPCGESQRRLRTNSVCVNYIQRRRLCIKAWRACTMDLSFCLVPLSLLVHHEKRRALSAFLVLVGKRCACRCPSFSSQKDNHPLWHRSQQIHY